MKLPLAKVMSGLPPRYITTFWDLGKECFVGIYDGKSSEVVKEFQQDYPYPKAIKNISIDMSPAFISGVNKYLPQADITFDRVTTQALR